MGTLIGHIIPGLALALLGVWHIINTINTYHHKGSSNFVSRFWYPFRSPFPKLEHLELILIFFFSIFAISVQVLDFPILRFAFKLDNFEHATMFLHLAIFSGLTLLAELNHSSEILSRVSGILATSVFGQELFLLHYHSADHVGLEDHYHWLLQLIVFVSLMSALSTASFPTSFPSALVLPVSVAFQGFWFMNMGFMLWVPKFVPQGCVVRFDDASSSYIHGAVVCGTHEASLRAKALANLQFSWILSGILIFVVCICLSLSRKSTFSNNKIVIIQMALPVGFGIVQLSDPWWLHEAVKVAWLIQRSLDKGFETFKSSHPHDGVFPFLMSNSSWTFVSRLFSSKDSAHVRVIAVVPLPPNIGPAIDSTHKRW